MPLSKNSIALRPMQPEEQGPILAAILGSVDVGVMLTDLDHVTIAANEQLGRMFGFAHDDAVHEDPESVRSWVRSRIVDVEAWERNLLHVYADANHSQVDELVLQNPHQVLERHTSPVLDELGQPFARLWTFEDRTSSHHQRKVQDLLQELSLHFDPKPHVVYDKIVRSLSEFYNSTSVLSILHGDMMHFQAIASPIPEVQAMTQNELSNTYCQFCLEIDAPIIVQNALDDPRHAVILPATIGVTRYVGVPLRKPDGEIIGTLCILDHYSDVDVTDDDLRLLTVMGMRVSVELEREARLQSLERDLEAAEATMIQTEKLAVTGTLAASVAHDIRNIVSAVRLDLQDNNESADMRLSRAASHMDRFNVLAARLLSYVKPKKVARQSVHLEDVVERSVAMIERHLQVTRTALSVEFPEQLPPVQADAGRLEHLMMNLLLNALQAMPQKGEIRICGGMDENRVWMELADTGPGMSAEQVARAFEPFVSSRPDGFGLGLYSCRQIMREMDGSITCRSGVGEGTTFRLEFPR
ncbi:MAG: GAF domain-containing protein [Chthonomonas sp.]|nr:GAF domain-containing protein [Chthonomonas sp.]